MNDSNYSSRPPKIKQLDDGRVEHTFYEKERYYPTMINNYFDQSLKYIDSEIRVALLVHIHKATVHSMNEIEHNYYWQDTGTVRCLEHIDIPNYTPKNPEKNDLWDAIKDCFANRGQRVKYKDYSIPVQYLIKDDPYY